MYNTFVTGPQSLRLTMPGKSMPWFEVTDLKSRKIMDLCYDSVSVNRIIFSYEFLVVLNGIGDASLATKWWMCAVPRNIE